MQSYAKGAEPSECNDISWLSMCSKFNVLVCRNAIHLLYDCMTGMYVKYANAKYYVHAECIIS